MDMMEMIDERPMSRGKDEAISQIKQLMNEFEISTEELESNEGMEADMMGEESAEDPEKEDRKSKMIEMMKKYRG